MEDILAVSLNQTYNEDLSKKELENITRQTWELSQDKVDNIKYIVGIKDKEIKTIYKVRSYKPVKYSFEVEEVDSDIENAIKNTFNNTISFYGGNSRRYLNSEDLK